MKYLAEEIGAFAISLIFNKVMNEVVEAFHSLFEEDDTTDGE